MLVSLGIGSHTFRLIAAEEKEQANCLQIIALVEESSRGVVKGSIVNESQVSQCVNALLKTVKKKHNIKPIRLICNILDTNFQVQQGKGEISVNGQVTAKHIQKVISQAQVLHLPKNHQPTNFFVRCFFLDQVSAHKNAESLLGARANILSLELEAISVSNTNLDTLENCIQSLGIAIPDALPGIIATAQAALPEEVRHSGVCLLDVGASTTSVVVYCNQQIIFHKVFEWGGDSVTHAIVEAFNTTYEQAEKLKVSEGRLDFRKTPDSLLKFIQHGEQIGMHYLSLYELIEVMIDAYLKGFRQIYERLQKENIARKLHSGYILAGGGSRALGITDLLTGVTGKRANLMRIDKQKIRGNEDIIKDPANACPIGLLLYNDELTDLKFKMEQTPPAFSRKLKRLFTPKLR